MRASPPARLGEFIDHARRTGWLYTKSVEYDGRAYVHIPLIYSTRVEAELEAYARALARFPQLIEVPFHVDVRHGVVASFDPKALDAFIAEVEDRQSCLSWTGRSACPPLAELVLRAEMDPERLRDAHEALIDAIALNLANPFVELAHPSERANVRFSVDRWFHERAQALRAEWREIVDFSWEAGFLPRRREVRAIWSDPFRLADHLGYTGPRPRIKPTIRMPDIPVPASDNVLTFLGELEEFRHYWQARLYARF